MHNSNARWRRLATLCVAITLVACGGGDSVSPQAQAAGTYTMVNANGLPLPATTFQNAAGRVEIVGGNIVLRSDGSFTELLTTRAVYTSGTVQENPITTAGDYTVSNTSITFTARSGSDQVTYTGALVDGRISYTYNNLTTVWQR